MHIYKHIYVYGFERERGELYGRTGGKGSEKWQNYNLEIKEIILKYFFSNINASRV